MKTQTCLASSILFIRRGALCIICPETGLGSASEAAYSTQKGARECTPIQECGLKYTRLWEKSGELNYLSLYNTTCLQPLGAASLSQ